MPAPRPPRSPPVLLTLGGGESGSAVVLADAYGPPVLGDLEPGALLAVAFDAERALRAEPGLVTPARVTALGDREEALAGALLRAVVGAPGTAEVLSRLIWLRGRSDGAAEPLTVLVDCRRPEWATLPFELWTGLPTGSGPLAGARVARLVRGSGRAGTSPRRGLAVFLWVPDPDDPACAEVASCLRAVLGATPRTRCVDVPDAPDSLPGTPDEARVLHVLAHGRRSSGAVAVALADEAVRGPREAAGWMGEALATLDAVVLDVCGAASPELSAASTLAGRLSAAGVPACVAPRTRWGIRASRAFSAAFYPALASGEDPTAAVEAGRRALHGLAAGHPDSRAWAPLLTLSDPRVPGLPWVLPRGPALAVFPPGAPGAEEVLARALQWAEASGFLGIEHLAAALARAEGLSPAAAAVQPALSQVPLRLASLVRVPGVESDVPAPTPRLRAFCPALSPGFSADALLRALARTPPLLKALGHRFLFALLDEPAEAGGSTVQFSSRTHVVKRVVLPAGAALELEVWGGPEDGRVVTLDVPGQAVGRHDARSAAADDPSSLYRGTPLTDPTLSRRHLAWMGGPRLEVLGATRLQRADGAPHRVDGPVDVVAGDLLWLGKGTLVEVVAVPSRA